MVVRGFGSILLVSASPDGSSSSGSWRPRSAFGELVKDWATGHCSSAWSPVQLSFCNFCERWRRQKEEQRAVRGGARLGAQRKLCSAI